MKHVLAISSQVVRGQVGLSAVKCALGALGHEVLAMPTILLSNHPGYTHGAGRVIEPLAIEEMIDALDANGWLTEIDAVISGYLPTADHVAAVRRAIDRLGHQNDCIYLCDPVIGDEPKGLYIDQAAAEGIRDTLIPRAEIITPNLFELRWLSGASIGSLADVRAAAENLAERVIVTSAQCQDKSLSNLIVDGGTAWVSEGPWRQIRARGTGDLLAGLVLGYSLNGMPLKSAGAKSLAALDALIATTQDREELNLIGSAGAWLNAPPFEIRELV